MPTLKSIVALIATMLVCGLYGAGVRRPFGALPRIPDVPYWLWHFRRSILIADWAFLAFVLTMTGYLFTQMSLAAFLFFGLLFYVIAELLSYKIRLVPSFYISVALAILATMMVIPVDWMAAPHGFIYCDRTQR
jgi:hypothetical protein